MTSSADPCDEDWDEIEQFLAELSERSESSSTLGDFASNAIRQTVEVLDAVGGSVWAVDEFGELQWICHADVKGPAWKGDDRPAQSAHREFLNSILQTSEPQTASLGGLLIAAPVSIDQRVKLIIEVALTPRVSADRRNGTRRLLALVSDLAEDFLRQLERKELKNSSERWLQYEAMSQRAHASLDLRDTAFGLVNDGRLYLDSDRVSLLVPVSGRLRVMAVSGVDTIDRRSQLVRSMEALGGAVAASKQWLRFRGDLDPFPPQLEQPLAEFVDESHSQVVDVVPLLAPTRSSSADPDDMVGVLVVERFDATTMVGIEDRIIRVSNLSSSALQNAIDYETLPMLSLARWARRVLHSSGLQKRRWLIAVLTAVATVILLSLVPARFRIEASGIAQPQNRRNVYAPFDGEVVTVNRGHDDQVSKDQVLVVLRSRELDLELQRLQGEFQTIQKKLIAVSSARVQSDSDSSRGGYSSQSAGQLAAEEQELQQELSSVQTQISLVRTQQQDLEVRSPIDGRILTWDPDDLLADRPVGRGQLLVSVADLDGPWVLELSLPDRRVGHVIKAQRERSEPLEVEFNLAGGAASSYRGMLEKISARSEVVGDDEATTRVLVSVSADAVQILRPGATVHARLDCGRRSLGYVWLHDLVETVRGWIFF